MTGKYLNLSVTIVAFCEGLQNTYKETPFMVLMSRLLLNKLEEWKGKKVAVSIEGDDTVVGILLDFDSDIVVIGDPADISNPREIKSRELLVSLANITYMTLVE
jgi:small nuclear ribonucleoprotein (snRNP)-like protein